MKLKRIISLTLAFLAVLSSLMILSSCNSDKKSSDKEDNGVSDSNYVSIDCDVLEITVTDDESAIKAIENVAESLGISDVDKELKIDNVTDVNQEKYYRMQQYYNDIPVYGKDIVLAVDDSGMATTVTSNVDPITETVDINATVSQKDVEKTISQYFTKVLKKGDDFNYSIPELKKEQQYIYKTEKGDFVLAYLVNTGFYDFLVDAKTSDVLDCISNVFTDTAAICYNGDGTEQFDGSFSESEKKYISYDMQRGIRVATYNKTNSRDKNNVKEEILKSVDNYFGNSVDADEVKKEYEKGVTLINNLAAIHDYFYKKYGENKPLNAYFNDGFDGGSNALGGYDTDTGEGYISMGYNTGVTDIDVMAHEYMHFISRSHVGWSRGMMIAGAINEGYSDIFGEIFESEFEGKDPDWLNRNDIINLNRNMASPSSSGYPEKISDENKSREDYSHAYSTVISHAAYLMWNGIDGNESMKIDVDTLADIWYRSILLLHSNADFQQCADAVYKSAKTLKKQITSEQLECVKKSFENAGIKVSLGSASTTCRGSSLYVNDINFEKYGNYHLKIFSMKDSQNPKIVLEKDVTDTNGVVLDFDAGVYTITVTDNDANGSKDEYSQIVNISKRSQYKFTGPVTIYTNFGGKTVSDFTMPAEKVVTLGEISVIEPELTPIDAASYSIKWSSSDESVATVSPNGEAGIITALAKGTATITAELTSGGKTITKTTSLRVASKARDTVLVLDVSGSMSGDPLDEMKKSAIQFCNDLLKDEYNNRVGIVFYDNYVSTIDLTSDLDMLVSRIEEVDAGATTDMEAGLAAADEMLESDSKADAIKNVVIMADGLPNRGKTSYSGSLPNGSYSGYYTDVSYANAVIDTAKQMMAEYNLYSLGFFHSLYGDEKDFATALMQSLTNQADGYHQVDRAEDLQFAFGDISEDINLGSKIVINIACPVDVSISYDGAVLSSASDSYNDATAFGTLQLLGKNKDIKVVSLDSNYIYTIKIIGTGSGKMDYSVNYFDENEQLSDYRSFESVSITTTTVIDSNTDNSGNNIALNIDEDGDGEVDVIWTAASKSKGEITYDKYSDESEIAVDTAPVEENNSTPVWTIVLVCVFVFVLVGAGIIVAIVCTNKKNGGDESSEFEIPERVPSDMVMCSMCGRLHQSGRPCKCQNECNKNKITENAERTSGFIQVTNGSMNGFSVPIKDGETLYLGKDPKFANLVFTRDYKNVSRVHCAVTLDAKANRYFVTDCSSNGTYLISKKRLIKGKRTPVSINTVLILANYECTVLLG